MDGPRVLMVEEGGFGGVGDYAARLSEALAAEGCAVQLATARDHPHGALPGVDVRAVFPYLRERGPVSRRLRDAGFGRVYNGAAHALTIIRLTPRARRFGLVHTHGAEWPPLAAFQHLLWRAAGAAIVHTPHNTFDRVGGMRVRFKEWVERLADVVIVHAQADLPNLLPSVRERAVVIPHGEYGGLARTGGEADRAAARAELGVAGDAVVALLFGQLREDKGVDVLLQAAAEVPEVVVVLAGEDKGALDATAALRADPRLDGRVIVREGFHSMEQAARFFAAADVSVLPYRRASASGVLLLSYGFACPPVVFPVGGLPEAVVDGETGWICAESTAQALIAALRDAVAAGPAQRARRGKAGAQLSEERYAWPAIARRTIAEAYWPARARRG
ncbi:glycosyltransferase family 4 protein [Svornostia abyssi]|uniref:Glycosyltransferase family 4 protein n=1 Tax=Svornostia abyssi TaxID=2898438 RepID=A0ABY5PLI5_9ACTN|nr:glycosyltransferase family 4 protein [Parviterribacteraceae bacterium J379]